ncbi:MAG: hypothetical protein WCQ47_02675, partial [bacterium]
DKEALGVIFNDRRFDFSQDGINEKSFNSFIRDKSRFSSVDKLYEKHGIPLSLRSIMDAILFVFSGVKTDRFPAKQAIKILSSVLSGLSVPKDGYLSLREQILEVLSKTIKVEHNIKDFPKVQSKTKMSDHDHIKTEFLNNMWRLKNEYSNEVIYPYSVYVKVPKEVVPTYMNRWTLYVDSDGSNILDKDSIYMIRVFVENKEAVIRVSSFLGYGKFDLDNTLHRDRSLKMYDILKKIIPAIDVFDPKVFPNVKSKDFVSDLELLFGNLKYGEVNFEII